MNDLHATVVGAPTPRIDAEADCATCPGSWVHDEVFGWLHNPGSRPQCVAPSPTIGVAIISGGTPRAVLAGA
jgi:hypothetical protein